MYHVHELPHREFLSATTTDVNLFEQGMEQVLQNMNRLNRNLESVIAVSFSTWTGKAQLLMVLLGWE